MRLPDDLAEWLKATAVRTGTSQGQIIRDQLERLRGLDPKPLMPLAANVDGPGEFSSRKGFSRTQDR